LVPFDPLPGVLTLPGAAIVPLFVLVLCATIRQPPNGLPVATGAPATRVSTAGGGAAAAPCAPMSPARMNAMVVSSCEGT
jgi:hypothetical protein